ncbi:MAG: His/Gly/Thr/Pro-type tRNA ligase C-terminal domain-containing protein, partial [Archaeoglobaceae archaeon]
FAIGFDRVCELVKDTRKKQPVIAVVNFPGFESFAFEIATKIRNSGFVAIVDVMGRNLRKQLSYANDVKADYAVIIGEEEFKCGEVKVKNLSSGEQFSVKIEDLTTFLSELKTTGT